MKARVFICSLAFMLAAPIAPTPAMAHDARPLFVQVTEQAPERVDEEADQETGTTVELRWRVPKLRAAIPAPDVELSETCRAVGPRSEINLRDSRLFEQRYACPEGLGGRRLTIRYPGPHPAISSLVWIERASGETYSRLLPPDELEYEIPAARTTLEVAGDYTMLGIRHILEGADHLLFVACLLLLARTWKRTLVTITGFTVAHSITLAASTLDVVRLPGPPVEAAIALSIVLVARELAVGKSDSLTVRYPVAVSSSFGLLHGFGFAAVLRGIGLPSAEVPAALLSFNVGVELGQILFVGVLWMLFRVVGSFSPKHEVKRAGDTFAFPFERPVIYAVGTLAVFWTIDRILAF